MNTKHRALAFILLAAGTLHGQVLYTNFGPNLSYDSLNAYKVDGSACFSQGLTIAERFTPSQTARFLDAKVPVYTLQGPNQVSIDLKTDVMGEPGALLEHFSVTNLATVSTADVITVNSTNHPVLVAGTFYWIVLSVSDPQTCNGWSLNSTGDAQNTVDNAASAGSPSGPWLVGIFHDGIRPAYQIDGAPLVSTLDPPFQVRYASNLTQGDSLINITNTGANGNNLFGPGYGDPAGNICVNVYAFSPDEQMISCCSCLVTPNGLVHVTANNDLVNNTLTGVRPNSIVVKLLATATGKDSQGRATYDGSSCSNSAAQAGSRFPIADAGLLAWGTTLHSSDGGETPAGPFAVTETPFLPSTLSAEGNGSELASLTNRCANIIGNGSSFGICRSCRLGGLGGTKLQ